PPVDRARAPRALPLARDLARGGHLEPGVPAVRDHLPAALAADRVVRHRAGRVAHRCVAHQHPGRARHGPRGQAPDAAARHGTLRTRARGDVLRARHGDGDRGRIPRPRRHDARRRVDLGNRARRDARGRGRHGAGTAHGDGDHGADDRGPVHRRLGDLRCRADLRRPRRREARAGPGDVHRGGGRARVRAGDGARAGARGARGAMSEAPIPLPEYPRPQLRRKNFTILNGWWDYAITPVGAAPAGWDGRILVPFSPETPASGVNRQLQPDETLHYRRTLEVTAQPGHRTILHFGAVDQSCRVLVNGVEVATHVGGYLPFGADITEALGDGTAHELAVEVRDVSDTAHHSVGKPRLGRGGSWCTAQSGIGQAVWLETVPDAHVGSLRMRAPGVREGMDAAVLELQVAAADGVAHPVSVTVLDDGVPVAEAAGVAGELLRIELREPRTWT